MDAKLWRGRFSRGVSTMGVNVPFETGIELWNTRAPDPRYGKVHTDGSRSGGQPIASAPDAKAETVAEIVAMVREAGGNAADTLRRLHKLQTLSMAETEEWERLILCYNGLAQAIEERFGQ
jgi:hypothetical protein